MRSRAGNRPRSRQWPSLKVGIQPSEAYSKHHRGTVSLATSKLYTRAVLPPAILACSSSGTPARTSRAAAGLDEFALCLSLLPQPDQQPGSTPVPEASSQLETSLDPQHERGNDAHERTSYPRFGRLSKPS